jgi:branched-chain amino acid transport system ATP-binding protein
MNQATSDIAAPDLLRVNDIEVIYDGAILAVAGVSLTVPKGGIVALLGANGAGKSTTLKAISGLVRAERAQVSRGSIEFLGCDTAGVDPSLRVRQGMVHVLEGRHVFAQLTVEDNLRSGGFVRGLGRQDMARDLERIYTWFPRLKTKRKTQAGLTSGGEQQMVAIGRALMTRPTLVLLDEPSMGLAPIIVQEIFEIVAQLNREAQVSFLIAEQNINVALKYASQACVLDTGRVVLSGSAETAHAGRSARLYLGKQKRERHDETIRNADILIIGGGLSGAMLAAQLLRLPGQRRMLVIEPRSELGRGEAYSAVELGHTLNGNAARMSVDPDNADDLTQWLTDYIAAGGWPESDEQHVPISELFPPRGIFGLYAQQRLAEARRSQRPAWNISAPRWSICKWMRIRSG